ncbi:MAG: hypothetical protein ABI664_23610 [bacterium]
MVAPSRRQAARRPVVALQQEQQRVPAELVPWRMEAQLVARLRLWAARSVVALLQEQQRVPAERVPWRMEAQLVARLRLWAARSVVALLQEQQRVPAELVPWRMEAARRQEQSRERQEAPRKAEGQGRVADPQEALRPAVLVLPLRPAHRKSHRIRRYPPLRPRA